MNMMQDNKKKMKVLQETDFLKYPNLLEKEIQKDRISGYGAYFEIGSFERFQLDKKKKIIMNVVKDIRKKTNYIQME